MADKQPNIVVFFWDNFGWGELGCYGGGVLRGAPTPRIDKTAAGCSKSSEAVRISGSAWYSGADRFAEVRRRVAALLLALLLRGHQLVVFCIGANLPRLSGY